MCFTSNNVLHVLFRNHGNLQDVENPLLATINNSKPSRFRTALPQVHTNICYSILIEMSTINVFISFINAHNSVFFIHLIKVIVSVVTTFLFLDYGVSVSYPTVVISALTGLNNETNPNESIEMTPVETSWLGKCLHKNRLILSKNSNQLMLFFRHSGSITYLGKLFGSIVCGFASEQFGRRNSMLLINIPLFITFGLYYYSDSVSEVFIASILLGFSTGFLKAPSSTYIAETRQANYCNCVI